MTLYAEYLMYQASMCDRAVLWTWATMCQLTEVVWQRN